MKDNKSIVSVMLGRLVGAVLVIALVCFASMLVSPDVNAAPHSHAKYLVLATIENIDSVANTMTVRLSDGTDRTLQLAKHVTVNGRNERRSQAESDLMAKERAVISYTARDGDETAVDVESLNHAMRKTVMGTLISADKENKILVLRRADGREEIFRVQNDAVIETGDSVMTFAQFEPQAGLQVTLHYKDILGMVEVSRIKH